MSHDDPFSRAGEHVKITEFDGRLILFKPLEYITGIKTKYSRDNSVSDAVDCDVVILDGPGAPLEVDSVRIFQARLVGALKRKVGSTRSMHLARLGTIPNKSGDEKDPRTWVLEDVTDAESDVAREYLAASDPDPFA